MNFSSAFFIFRTMEPRLISPDETKEYFTEEKCHILELLNIPELRSQSIARARVEVGVTTSWHLLDNTSEIYYILQGRGTVEIGETFTKEISANELVYIPKNTRQRIKNTSNEDLIFLCFCVPAFDQKNYKSDS